MEFWSVLRQKEGDSMHKFWTRCVPLLSAFLLSPAVGCAADVVAPKPLCGPGMTSVRPATIDSILMNPGMGFESFNRSCDAPIDNEGWFPEESIAYYRWYWIDVEPEDGVVDFARIDAALEEAERCGQTFAFRIMTANGEENPIPLWARGKIPGVEYENGFVPDFNSAVFLKYSIRLINALGARYDGNPLLDHVDVGTVGLWGEWHVAGVDGAEPIRNSTAWKVIDAYRVAFPRTTLLMLINSVGGLMHSKELSMGWRADCWGDRGGLGSDGWNHMENMYPVHIANAGIAEQWKIAPVALETCWDMRRWMDSGWDLGEILDWALTVHASVINAKSSGIPAEWRPQIEAFMTKLGYRLSVDELCVPASVAPGSTLDIRARWLNTGVAPPYKPYRIAYRLRDKGHVVWSAVSDAKVGVWTPGSRIVGESFVLPTSLGSGDYALDIALLAPTGEIPAIRLANAGRRSDGWYPLTTVRVN